MQSYPGHKCYAHEMGRMILAAIAYGIDGEVKPSETQQRQMDNVYDMEEALSTDLQTRVLLQTANTDKIMEYMIARCKAMMPDAKIEPRALMYARLLATTMDEAMLICAMLFAMHLDIMEWQKQAGIADPNGLLTYGDLLTHTRANVLDSEMAAILIDAQKARIAVEGLDQHRLNHKDSYRIDIEV